MAFAGTIYILLYTDELEIVNPLGSKRGVHKLYVVYFSVLNIHPQFRSKIKHLHLVIIAKYADVQRYGQHDVLKPLLTDLLTLQHEGLSITRNGAVLTVNVIVNAFIGDNLSMNKLGGFTTSFSSGRVCRFCMAQAGDLTALTREELCVLRTKAAHQKHLGAIASNPEMKKLYGVTEPSPLLALNYFDVTAQLPPDLMHDIFEGSLAYVIHHVLQGLVADCVLRPSDIEKVVHFRYGVNDKKNRPEAISETFLRDYHALRGTASQKWCLFRLLPLIIGSSIPEGNDHWCIYLAFREVVDLLLAEEVPIECVPYLEVRIQDFLIAFVAQYTSARLIPKLHYLIHYPRFIVHFGPLKHYWCMRFEGKHQYFKTIASRVKNFRNICKTLASRHQLAQSYWLYGRSLDYSLTTTGAKQVDLSALKPCVAELAEQGLVWEVRFAAIQNATYHTGDILILKKGENPEFSQVTALYVISGKLYLLIEDLHVDGFRRHRYSYKVRKTDYFRVTQPCQEASYQRLDLYIGCEVMPNCEISFCE
ncbi:uncharacterized protein LOC135373883 [Ornithodoros turicata]|uniref:uncharacterized protein LOC135373883 n=1 Tax=Ornithodoros turicata TaxID=34597 RepID=UPI003139F230